MNMKEADRRLTLIKTGNIEKALSFVNQSLYEESNIKLDEEYRINYLDTYKIYRYEWIKMRLSDLRVFFISKEGDFHFVPLAETIAYKTIIRYSVNELCNDTENIWQDYETYTDRLKKNDLNFMHTKSRFESLIQALEQKGFDDTHPILIDDDNRILDGQHRAVWLAGKYGLDSQIRMLRLYTLNDDKFDFFPFERIPRDSRVVIYGAGNFGEAYIRQLDQTGYSMVAGLIDRDADRWNREIKKRQRIECQHPEEIKNFAEKYDYIVIASRSKKHVQDMKKVLDDWKIDKEKVIAYF